MLSMKRARQRSTDAKRAMAYNASKSGIQPSQSALNEYSFKRRIELAEAELRELDEILSMFSKAGTVVDLEETSKEYALRLSDVNKQIRHLSSENARREKELDRLAKQPVDLAKIENSLRKELLSLRQRNSQLSENIESNEKALMTCEEVARKLRTQIDNLRGVTPSNMIQRRKQLLDSIDELKKEKTELAAKWNLMRERDSEKIHVLEALNENGYTDTGPESSQSMDIQPEVPKTVEQNEPSVSAIEPLTALQSPTNHALIAEPCILVEDGTVGEDPIEILSETIPLDIDRHDRPESVQEPVEETVLPEARFLDQDEPDKPSEEFSDDFHATDEAMNAAECAEIELLRILPRRLFQASSAKEDDSHELGEHRLSPVPPLVNIPRLFHVQSRSSSVESTRSTS
jgi:hypothetical protein